MRAEGRTHTPLASLSRSFAAVRGQTLIICVPGSPRGAAESLDAVEMILAHTLDTLVGAHRARAFWRPLAFERARDRGRPALPARGGRLPRRWRLVRAADGAALARLRGGASVHGRSIDPRRPARACSCATRCCRSRMFARPGARRHARGHLLGLRHPRARVRSTASSSASSRHSSATCSMAGRGECSCSPRTSSWWRYLRRRVALYRRVVRATGTTDAFTRRPARCCCSSAAWSSPSCWPSRSASPTRVIPTRPGPSPQYLALATRSNACAADPLADRLHLWPSGPTCTHRVFLAYLPRSKHLHIATAVFNTAFGKLRPQGQLPAMDLEAEERDVRRTQHRRSRLEGPARRLHAAPNAVAARRPARLRPPASRWTPRP